VIRQAFPLVALLVLAAGPASAQDARPIGLDEALGRFAADNLELRLARSRAERAAGVARQAGAFPNPSLNATHEPLSGGGGSYSETYLTASQRLELSGSRGARSDASGRRRDAALELLRADSLRLAFEVKRAYIETLLAQERRAVTARIAGVFRTAAESASERFDAGDVSLYSLRRIRVERARYETLLADTEMEVGSAQRLLAAVVAPTGSETRLAAAPLPAATPPAVPEGVLGLAAVEGRPELAAARAEVQAEEAQARLVRAERIPDLTATGGFKRQSDGLRGVFLGLSVPLPVFDRGGGAVEAADAGLRAAEERLALTRRQLENDVLRAIEAYRTLLARAGLLTEDPAGGDTDLLDMALVAYGEGAMELVELLDAADALHEASIAEARLQASLWIAYFDLERALGGFDGPPARGDAP
jgi:cobalt-zinc-cadmium efflux system outer membrane protein